MEPIMTQPTSQDRMALMIAGYWTSKMVYGAAKLGLAALLSDGPKTAAGLARATSP